MLKYYRNVKNGEIKPLSPEIVKAAGTASTWKQLTEAEVLEYTQDNPKVNESIETPFIPEPTLGEKGTDEIPEATGGKVVSMQEQIPSVPQPTATTKKPIASGKKEVVKEEEKEKTPSTPVPPPAPVGPQNDDEDETVETIGAEEV